MAHYVKISDVTAEQYDELMDTNVRSHVFLTQLALPHIIKSKGMTEAIHLCLQIQTSDPTSF